MPWPSDEPVSDNSFLFNERCWETGHLGDVNESPFPHSQYSFPATNQNMLHSTQGQAEGTRNDTFTSQYSIAGIIETTSQPMGYITPLLGQPTSLSGLHAHTMQSPPQRIPNRDTQVRKRPRACPKAHKAETPTGPFKCGWNGCLSTKSFGRLNVLWRHIETQHLLPGAYKCHREGCGKSFNRKDNLGEHVLRVQWGKNRMSADRARFRQGLTAVSKSRASRAAQQLPPHRIGYE
ncbi:hypothetical protein N7453_005999 [Penicillium expansum]|nr:hypothetical protein N7453_005999 [Penicillium expansum]